MIHFLYIPFTGLGIRSGYRGDAWLKNRIRVFKEFTLRSIMAQTNHDFVLWISWRPEDRHNPIIENLKKELGQLRALKVIFTYGGVCFWDDKYSDDQASIRLFNALAESLPDLREAVGDAESVLMTIQPSDDMYFSTFVDEMNNREWSGYQVAGYDRGYIMNYSTKEIAFYNPDTTPPFYTINFPAKIFLDPTSHYDYIGPYKSHEYVKDYLMRLPLKDRGFVVGTHGENISTVFNHPYTGRMLTLDERDAVLMHTGTYFADPIVIKKGVRLLARQLLNLLPYQNEIRAFYHSLPEKWQYL